MLTYVERSGITLPQAFVRFWGSSGLWLCCVPVNFLPLPGAWADWRKWGNEVRQGKWASLPCRVRRRARAGEAGSEGWAKAVIKGRACPTPGFQRCQASTKAGGKVCPGLGPGGVET